ncbi:plasmid partitioning protein RepB [Maritalea porphyrae]|uniref:plasmid partitioning protein RepB n=1 Tax=Maritalea porphyrae TaxID=880732 RepID=UPI0022AE596F|nr:plasmid partitioning protein RepB [Maritalea porphyrae]MCZ4274162.1 plasmid partitioning protein RepB [Maritalea porphyrae]
MSRKKSIASSFGNLTHNGDAANRETSPSPTPAPSRVAAGVIGATQRSMTEIREERDRLLAEAERGGQIITLDPSDIDPSPFRDRLPDDDPREFERFKQALQKEGQRTPISVRRDPKSEHKYQIVFGHRRWRALADLGQKVEARLGTFSDRDLVVAQGMENAERQDLSWIERALFCAEMEAAGIKPKDIKSALGVDDAQMSKFRTVTRTLPKSIVEAIGRAPNIGRPRWLDLCAAVADGTQLEDLDKTLSSDKVKKMTSDDRFMACLGAIAGQGEAASRPARSAKTTFGDVGEVSFGKSDMRIRVAIQHADQFRVFMANELPDLEKRFLEKLRAQSDE